MIITNWSTPLTIYQCRSKGRAHAPPPQFFFPKSQNGPVQGTGYDTSQFDIADLLDFFESLGNACKLLLSKICTFGKLMLVMAATNAISEHLFSALKRVKTYLHSTTGEGRLNHLMLLHVHKELADGIDMVKVANEKT